MVLTNNNYANKTPFCYYYWWKEYEEIQIDYPVRKKRRNQKNKINESLNN